MQAQGRVERFDLHSLPEAQFGVYNSKQRLYTVTNAVNHVLTGMGYLVEGLAAFPSMQQLHSSRGRLYLFLDREAELAMYNSSASIPAHSVRGSQMAASLAMYTGGLGGSLLRNGIVAGGPREEVSSDQVVADVQFADYMQPTRGTAGYKYPWPGDVVLKIRNLPQALHKPGVAAAVLQAAGYEAHVLVGDHYMDAVTAIGDRIAGIPDRTVLCAIVRAPAEDQQLARIPRLLQWPGVPGLVKIAVQLSSVISVGSHSAPPDHSYSTDTLDSSRQGIYRVPEQRPFPGGGIVSAAAAVPKED
jgi:hypothetical protein